MSMGKNKTEPDGETVRRKEGRKDGWLGTSVNNTVRFCFEPLAVSRLLVFHAFLQRRIPLALLYSLSASSLLHLCLFFPSSHTLRMASVYNTGRVYFTTSLT